MRTQDSFVLVIGFAAFAAASTLGCSSDVTPSGGNAPATAPSDPSPPAGNDAAGGDVRAPRPVTVRLTGGGYSNSAGGGTFALSIYFEILNDTGEDITSIETLSYDFGGGNVLALRSPACRGDFAVRSGKQRLVEAHVLVEVGGNVRPEEFKLNCLQPEFALEGYWETRTAKGAGPPNESFADPIAITVGGKMTIGTFVGATSAPRFN